MTDDSVGVITVPCLAGSTVARFIALVDGLYFNPSTDSTADGALVTTVAEAPWDIPALTQAFLGRGFMANAEVTAGRINRWMSPPAPVAADDLRRVAARFLNQLV